MTGFVSQRVESDGHSIVVSGLTKRYGNQVACNGIDLCISRGRTFGLLGPNGAGKSTLIRMLMGLTESDAGRASVLGCEDLRSSALRQRVGYVPELHFMYRWMTIREILEFVSPLYVHWDTELAKDLVDKFELPMRKRVSSLSKGMTAKLGLLLALAHHPDLLILDEPTSGLDPIVREDFLESVLQNHTCSDRTVLFSSHHVDDVERVADEVGIMVHGRLVAYGSPDELRARIKRVRVVLQDGRLPSQVPKQAIHQKLQRREWLLTVLCFSSDIVRQIEEENDPVSVAVIDLSLEEIFKDLVRGHISVQGSDDA
jgi:ABC-2 type transport system ATP-binding protein